jgi:hypothetical protein
MDLGCTQPQLDRARDGPRRLFRSVTTITRRPGRAGYWVLPRQHAPRSCLQDKPLSSRDDNLS